VRDFKLLNLLKLERTATPRRRKGCFPFIMLC